MPFTLRKKLEQHSPHLHFQHGQDGATLRATELKPKLDAYLKTWIIENQGRDVWKRLKVATAEGEEKDALDYKLRISAEREREYLVGSYISRRDRERLESEGREYLTNTPYFADNPLIKKGHYDDARRALTYRNMEVEVFSFHERLVEWVEHALHRVLAFENFGTRQSKGFGSFSVAGTTVEEFEDYILEHPSYQRALYFTFDQGYPSASKIFKLIDDEYKVLKGGTQDDDSQMMLYFDETQEVEWEKEEVKRHLVRNRNRGTNQDLSTSDKKKYIRALLGVAELYEFPQIGQTKVHVECYDKNQKKKPIVERFRSPITFKPFRNKVYMLCNPIPEVMYDRTFRFHNDRGQLLINTPSSDQPFDLDDFLYEHTNANDWNYVGE